MKAIHIYIHINFCLKRYKSETFRNMQNISTEIVEDKSNDYFHFWKASNVISHDKIKHNNAKYYRLYPKEEGIDIMSLIPNFENIKPIYTRCDYNCEKRVQEIVLTLEQLFKNHNALVENEMEKQNKIIDDAWVNSQKYLLLTGSGVCVKTYPEFVSFHAEKRYLNQTNSELQQIHASNLKLTKSLEDIQKNMAELHRRCDHLDFLTESPFIMGTASTRPLMYVLILINDIFSYFYQYSCKLQCWAELLDVKDTISIEDYAALIKPKTNNVNRLMEYLIHCSCLRSKKTECIQKHLPC
ncbi:uncharacterized protein LOC142229173 [Haematobia irritans]|uniref:uncharacterized protein LOC142229173 n=1 Tax=Haematobia irritans TaxID=7368 RepID=UPI003F506A34